MYIKPIDSIDETLIEQEWDAVAAFRDDIIRAGRDISLVDVTEPFVLETISRDDIKSVVDCGCGTGHLSYLMVEKLKKHVVGIDISGNSIKIAKKNYCENEDLSFIKTSIRHYAERGGKFDACVANMVLMDMVDVNSNLSAMYQMLNPKGLFCFTITHPCFWPIYWEYFKEPWFEYSAELCIRAPFQISSSLVGHTTHIHRPLTKYISMCQSAGFEIIRLEELYPKSSHLEYDYKYDFPRFMGFVCQKGIR